METKLVKLHTEDLGNGDRDSESILITQATYHVHILSDGFPFTIFFRIAGHNQLFIKFLHAQFKH